MVNPAAMANFPTRAITVPGELRVLEQIQGIPRGAGLLWDHPGGRCRVRGQAGRAVWSDQGRAGPATASTWLRSSEKSFRLLTEATLWIGCLASSTLPRVRSHRADSGRAL